MNEKKILFVTNTIQTMSGAAKVMRFVASNIAKYYSGVEALIICDKEILNEIEGVKIRTLGCKTEPKLLWRAFAIRRLREAIKEINPDIICTFVADACFLTRAATLGMPAVLISCDRGDPSWRDGSIISDYLWDKVTRWTYRNSDVCVFQLPQVRDYFGEKNLNKTFVIPNPFVPISEITRESVHRKQTIVSAGRFTDQKGYDVLIDAFAIVQKKYPEYGLVIYGDGVLKESYLKQINNLKLGDHVHLPGFVKNVSEAIMDDGIFVLSSRYEGIPNSMMEALSMGLPCVATDCSPGGARFLSDGERRALIVPMNDAERLAEAICKVISDDELAKTLSQNAVEVRTEFAPERITALWYEVFEICCSI